MKRVSIGIICFYVFIFLLVFGGEFSYLFEDINLNPNDYARITDVEYKAVVVDEPGSEGKVVITERLTFDVHAASRNNTFWELWRDLPEDSIDGVKVHYKVNSVKQILEDGTSIIYEESPKLYWDDYDYVSSNTKYGPGKWYHSEGPYNENARRYECVFFYIDDVYREEMVFEIEYEMYNASLKYNDCSDLYLALYSGNTCKYLESFKAEILFPNKDMPAKGNYDVYTYGTNANDFPVKESATLNRGYYTFSFELDEDDLQFKPYNNYIEFDLVSHGEDKHIFTEYAPDNYYTYDNVLGEIYEEQQEYANTPAKYKRDKIIVLVIALAATAWVTYYSLTAGRRAKTKNTFYEPTEELTYYRDIPSDLDPNFAANLVFCKHNMPKDDSGIYSAILLSLARKGYIEITETSYNNVEIRIRKMIPKPALISTVSNSINNTVNSALSSAPINTATTTEAPDSTPDYEPLTTCEEYYFNLLVRHTNGNSVNMNIFQTRVSNDYENTDTFATNIKNSTVNIGVKGGYFQKADYLQPRKKMCSFAKTICIIGIIFAVLVNLISSRTRMDLAFGAYTIFGIGCILNAVYLWVTSHKYVLLTQFGEDEYVKWRGLYNFLKSDTLINERTVVELPLWEKYLVYATAFGLSEKVIQAIGIRCPDASESPVLDNNYYRSTRFRSHGRSFRSSVRSGSYTARSGGGYGGGGFGYGGGGRGGGGGGGGH